MKKTIFTSLLLILLFSLEIKADTIRMMQYNLMYYTTSGPTGCDNTTNNLDSKDANLKTVIQYLKPDVFCVNEIGSNASYVSRLLQNVLNTDGVNYYASCPLTNISGGVIANMMYYNQNKLGFHSHFFIQTSVRDINLYKMYYKSAQLPSGDTTFITFIIAHLKAGTTGNDEQTRYLQAQALMNKLTQLGVADNYILSGDFNLYTSEEDAYQCFINNPNSLIQFRDPINQEGNWHENSSYAMYHTQSTRTGSPDCFSGGGMDDRFDFILVSSYILSGVQQVKYINNSYKAVGQDGHRFNGSLISPANTSLPGTILNALYNISDHIPVMSEFEITATSGIAENSAGFYVTVENPVQDNLTISLHPNKAGVFTFDIYAIDGRHLMHFRKRVDENYQTIRHDFPYPSSLYILKITDDHQRSTIKKIVK